MADAPPTDGKVTFVQYFLPALEAGEYTLAVAHTVASTDPKQPFTETYRTRADFLVAGTRWSIDPAEIDSMFPPPETRGEFANVLAHVVVTRRTLPWERSPAISDPKVAANASPDPGVPSWLALLMFDEADPPPPPQTAQLSALSGAGATVLCYPTARALEWGEKDSDACRFIDVERSLFDRLAPSLNDLTWLAHGRRVTTARKAGPDAGLDQEKDYAIVFGNRLPARGHRSTVHLVSLEGLGAFLPQDDGTPSDKAAPFDHVRLVSLATWAFDALDEKETFAQVMGAVRVGPLLYAPPPDVTPDPSLSAAIGMGYVALEHGLRDGGRTASWIRGPLVPYATTRSVATPVDSADAVLRYDPGSGLFDASDAVAWQLGRLLALQSKEFSAQLYRWKHATSKAAVDQFERDQLTERILPTPPARAAAGRAPVALPLKSVALDVLKQAVHAFADPVHQPHHPEAHKRAPARKRPAKDLHAFLTEPVRMAAATGDGLDPPAVVTNVVRNLRHLVGVPVQHLVPDERILPDESLRFFYLDQGWVDCLVDGALSLGRATEGDLLREVGHAAAARLRAGTPDQVITGFLLRSRAVKHWPGLEVAAFQPATAPEGVPGDQWTALTLLRLDRLGPEVMIGLFDRALTLCRFHEPPEGLHFGVDIPADPHGVDPSRFFKTLRTPDAGKAIAPPLTMPLHYRDTGTLVLAIATFALAMSAAFKPKPAAFTAAEFALEMIEGVDQVTFGVGS